MDTKIVLLNVSGYHISPTGDCAVGSNSAASVIFRATFSEDWEGMAIVAKFTDAADESVTDILLLPEQKEGGSWDIKMPHEAAKYDGEAKLSFTGALLDGDTIIKRNTTKPLAIRVIASYTDREGDNTAPIAPTDAEQLHNAAIVATDRAGQASRHAAEANEAKKDAVSAQAEAETAKIDAVSAKEAAEAASKEATGFASSAEANAKIASDSASGALEAQSNSAQIFTQTQSLKLAAEAAKEEAVTAMGAAISAKGAAEAAQSYAEEAQVRAEVAADFVSDSAKLIVDLAERWYDCYATEEKSGFAVHTTLGAENIPPKRMLVYRQNSAAPAYKSITIRQLGKNLFDPSEDAFEAGYYLDENGDSMPNANYSHSKAFTPVLPNTDYVFSGRIVGKKTANTVAFYDANGVFLDRFTPKKEDGKTALNTPAQFKTPSNCYFIRYNASHNVFEYDDVQLEIGETATAFESYAPEDYVIDLKDKNGHSLIAKYKSLDLLSGTGITFSGTAIRFTPPPVKTRKGINNFFVLTGTLEEEKVMHAARISATLRLDPTLVYEKLSTAIIAAGAT